MLHQSLIHPRIRTNLYEAFTINKPSRETT
jgi:hypothetical protein